MSVQPSHAPLRRAGLRALLLAAALLTASCLNDPASSEPVRPDVLEIASLSHPRIASGQEGFVFTVTGTGFTAQSVVRLDSVALETRVAPAGGLEAVLTEAHLSRSGTHQVTVLSPSGAVSNAAPLELYPVAPVVAVLPVAGGVAGRAVELWVHGRNFTVDSRVLWNGAPLATRWISSTRLAATVPASLAPMPVAAAITVSTPNGGVSGATPFSMRAHPAVAVASLRTLDVAANDLAYDPVSQRLYASVAEDAPRYANHVVAIDPATGEVTASVELGGNPGALAVSHGGQYLYVSLEGARAVRQLTLPDLAIRRAFPTIGSLVAAELEAVPGRPGMMAVEHVNRASSPRHVNVCMYEDAAWRGCTPQGALLYGSIAFAGDGATLYGYDDETSGFELTALHVTESGGLEVGPSRRDVLSGYYLKVEGAAGRLYTQFGHVVDPGRGASLGVMHDGGGGSFRASVAVSPELGRAFYLLENGDVEVWDVNTLSRLGTLSVGPIRFEHPALSRYRLVLWGSGGLAFRDGEKIHIVRTPAAAG